MTQKTSLFIAVITILGLSSQKIQTTRFRKCIASRHKLDSSNFYSRHTEDEKRQQGMVSSLNNNTKRSKSGRAKKKQRTKRRIEHSSARGNGTVLLWAVRQGNDSWVRDRLNRNGDFVEGYHIAAARKNLSGIGTKLAQLKNDGYGNSLAAQMHQLRLKECQNVLSSLREK